MLRLETENSLPVAYSAQDLIDVLSSGMTGKLNKELTKYKSFIILNNSTPEFSKRLIEELGKSEPDFDAALLDKIVKLRNQHIHSTLMSVMDETYLAQNYNKYGITLLSNPAMEYKYRVFSKTPKTDSDDEFLKYALSTTTKDNIALREYYIDSSTKLKMEKSEWSEHAKAFFERLDKDEDFRKIYKYITNASEVYETPENLMYFADVFTPKLLAGKVQNFFKIIQTAPVGTKKEDIAELLKKNLNNKFYIAPSELTDRIMLDEYKANGSMFPELTLKMQKLKRTVKYKVLPKIFGTGKEITTVDIKPAEVKPTEVKPKDITPEKIIPTNVKHEKKIRPRVKIPQTKYEPVDIKSLIDSETHAIQQIEKPVKKTVKPKASVSTEPTPYQLKRLQIKEDGLKLLKKKIHTKRDFGTEIRSFTKMRNGFLDEMFTAIKELRQQDRENGIKRSKNTSADVIELYNKINGKNRKLVKSMLNERTVDGKRKFDLKQIADMITPAYPQETKLSKTGKNLVQSVMYRLFSKSEGQA